MDSGLARRIRKKESSAPGHPRAARAGGSPSPRAHQYKGNVPPGSERRLRGCWRFCAGLSLRKHSPRQDAGRPRA